MRAVAELTGLVDVAQQLGDFDEASHRALRLLLQPLVVLPEALHLGLQHRLVLLLLKDIGTQQNKSRRSDRCGRNGRGATGTAVALRKLGGTHKHRAWNKTTHTVLEKHITLQWGEKETHNSRNSAERRGH